MNPTLEIKHFHLFAGAGGGALGNAVPPPAATAIAGVMGQVLLMARSGLTFSLSSTPIWVRELAMGLAVDQ